MSRRLIFTLLAILAIFVALILHYTGLLGRVLWILFVGFMVLFLAFGILIWTTLAIQKLQIAWLFFLLRSKDEAVRESAAKALGAKGDYTYDESWQKHCSMKKVHEYASR